MNDNVPSITLTRGHEKLLKSARRWSRVTSLLLIASLVWQTGLLKFISSEAMTKIGNILVQAGGG